jgi:CBS domain-containing protein
MTKCSYCGTANLDGSDVCEHCLEPLGELEPGRIDSEMERCLLHDRVVQLLPRKPIIVEPSTTVGQVLERLVERSIGCVLVVEDERLVGIFTERDAVVRVGVAIDDVRDHAISEFMTPTPETVEIDAQIAYALQRMDVGGYRHLPVTSQGRVIGVISIRDILKYLARHLEVVEY